MIRHKILQIIIVFVLTICFVFSTVGLGYSYSDTSDKNISLVCGPYSQRQESTQITICWQMSEITSDNHVRWGLTPDCTHCSSAQLTYLVEDMPIYNALIFNLEPNSKYFYRVVSDSFSSPIYSFQTLTTATDEITFVAYGDTRGEWDNYSTQHALARLIEQENPSFVLHTGDLVDTGTRVNEWISFFSNSTYIHNSTLYPALGNHELNGRPYYQYFTLDHNERWYSFNAGSVCIICLDSNFLAPFRPTQYLWLIKTLRSNTQPFTVAFFHHPLYSSGSHGSTMYLRGLWKPLFQFFEIDIVVNGHDHHYERGIVNNVTYVVSGGGGAPIRDVGSNWWTQYAEKTFHYCCITANQTTLTCSAINITNSVIDTFTIHK